MVGARSWVLTGLVIVATALGAVVLLAATGNPLLIPLLVLPAASAYGVARTSTGTPGGEPPVHDSLTGLPSRTLFYDRVEQAIRAARRSGRPVAVMLIDLHRFKDVNEGFGHIVGDLLLQQIGPRIQSTLRETDTVARLDGDQFAVMLPSLSSTRDAAGVAEKILEALRRPFCLDEASGQLALDVDASVGISIHPDHGAGAEALVLRARDAMSLAKENHGGWQLFADRRSDDEGRHLTMLGEIRRAMENGDLHLHFQPKIDMHTGRVTGMEALIRWANATRGWVPAEEFMPTVERTGLIRSVALYTLEEAMRQWTEWRRRGVTITVAVNVSRRSLLNLRFPDEVQTLLDRWEMDPAFLELEITESSIMSDPERAGEVLGRLSSMGMKLTLDDFGVGYTSLSHLKKLPLSKIKIDRSFVLGMGADPNDNVIVRSTIDLAHNLGLAVVAEGVETRDAWNHLWALGCDMAQGFFLGSPMPAADVVPWCRSNTMPFTLGLPVSVTDALERGRPAVGGPAR